MLAEELLTMDLKKYTVNQHVLRLFHSLMRTLSFFFFFFSFHDAAQMFGNLDRCERFSIFFMAAAICNWDGCKSTASVSSVTFRFGAKATLKLMSHFQRLLRRRSPSSLPSRSEVGERIRQAGLRASGFGHCDPASCTSAPCQTD